MSAIFVFHSVMLIFWFSWSERFCCCHCCFYLGGVFVVVVIDDVDFGVFFSFIFVDVVVVFLFCTFYSLTPEIH